MVKTLIPYDNTPSTPLKIASRYWHYFIGYHLLDHVRTGLTFSNGGGLTATLAVGDGFIQGCYFATDATINRVLTDNSTNYVYVQLSRNVATNPIDWNLTHNTTGTPPTDSMLLATVVTSGGSISTITDRRTLKADNATLIGKLVKFFGNDLKNYVGLKAPSGQATQVEFTLPGADGVAGAVLKTNASAVLGFSAHPGMVLINADDADGTSTGLDETIVSKSFSLPANSYSKIMVVSDIKYTHPQTGGSSSSATGSIYVAGLLKKSQSAFHNPLSGEADSGNLHSTVLAKA